MHAKVRGSTRTEKGLGYPRDHDFRRGAANIEFVKIKGVVAQIPFRFLKRIFGHSKVRFTANLKLALWAQTLDLRPFRFTKNGWLKFFNVRSRRFGQPPEKIRSLIRSQIYVFFSGGFTDLQKMLDRKAKI